MAALCIYIRHYNHSSLWKWELTGSSSCLNIFTCNQLIQFQPCQCAAKSWLNSHVRGGCDSWKACDAVPLTEFPGHPTLILSCVLRDAAMPRRQKDREHASAGAVGNIYFCISTTKLVQTRAASKQLWLFFNMKFLHKKAPQQKKSFSSFCLCFQTKMSL